MKKVEEQMKFDPQTTKKLNRDIKEVTGSFWSAASIFSKKLQKWRQKQKLKKERTRINAGSAALSVENSIGRHLKDTQSEIGEYGYARRSCDTDVRFSIDAGRFSLDPGRISLDEPRASWDGCLIGRTAAPPRMLSMLSAVEDSPLRNTHIPAEESPPPRAATSVMDEIVPGGTEQTKEYYTDSSSRRRKSLDRCSTTKKISASVIAEIDELELSALNTKVTSSQNKDAKDSISQRDDYSHEETKKSKRWSWNIFGLLQRKNGNKYEEEDGRSGVDRMFSGSWNVEARKGFDPKMMRSNSSVNWRSSVTEGGEFRRNSVDGYVSGKKKYSSNYRPVVPASQSLTSFY